MVLIGKVIGTGEKASIFKTLCNFRPTPKPWVAGSNPPAPAKIIRTHSSECVLIILLAVLCDSEPHRILPKGKITVGLAPKLSENLSQTIAQVGVLNPPRDTAFPIIPTVPTFPFGTASKKQQSYHRSFKKSSKKF